MEEGSTSPAEAHARLRAGFASGVTADVEFRLEQLRKIRAFLVAEEEALYVASQRDHGRSKLETLLLEMVGVHSELRYFAKNLRKLTRPYVASTSIGDQLVKERSPLGVVLNIAPYNLPVYLSLRVVIGALAAGNCVVLKPSEVAPECARFLMRLDGVLDPRVFAVVTGTAEVATELLALRWDQITFTGGVRVGRIVMQAAAKHLTPVLLELGGKNPGFVTSSADLEAAASSILFSRLINCGQLCLAVDYCLVEDSVYDGFKAALLKRLKEFYGDDPRSSPSLSRLISARHFERVSKLLEDSKGNIVAGGGSNAADLYFEPTIVEVDGDDSLMSEEIFGPILSLIRIPSFEQGVDFVNKKEKPLAVYIFSTDSKTTSLIKDRTSSGSVAVNETVVQVSAPGSHLGGVGESGMGSYGFEASFATYSHSRPCLYRRRWWSKLNQMIHQQAWTKEDGSPNMDLDKMARRMAGIPASSHNLKPRTGMGSAGTAVALFSGAVLLCGVALGMRPYADGLGIGM